MTRDIDFGAVIHTFQGDHVGPDYFERVATAAEELGFDLVWVGDHVTLPDEIPPVYPFSADGEPGPFFHAEQDLYDAFEVLPYVAAVTDEVRLGPHVCIVPYRHPVVLAKLAFSLEAVSRGRLEFGVGTGWLPTEFEVLGVPFGERGSRTDEFLDLFERACEEGETAFDGPHHSFRKTGFHPTPERDVPIWIGGHSGPAYRRVGEYGDGWATVWDRPDGVREERERILDAWDDHDRDGEPGISVARPLEIGEETEQDADRPLVGAAEKVAGDVEAYAAAGATCVTVDFFTTDPDEQIEQMERFADGVLSAF